MNSNHVDDDDNEDYDTDNDDSALNRAQTSVRSGRKDIAEALVGQQVLSVRASGSTGHFTFPQSRRAGLAKEQRCKQQQAAPVTRNTAKHSYTGKSPVDMRIPPFQN